MGLAQSQEQSEMAAVETEWHGKGDEAIDKAMETVSRDEGGSCPEAKWDVETDDTNCAGQGLFSPGHPENTGEGEHSEAPGSAPPTTGTEELKSESNSLEQRKETAAGDEGTEKDREREGGLGQATDAEHELIRHSQASGSPVMETGNHSMHDNSSSESPCGAKDRPCFDQSHPLNTEECLCQSGPQVKSTKLHNQSDSKTQSIKERLGQSDTQMDCKEELVDQSDSQMDCKEDFLVPSDSHMRSTEECIVQSGSQSGAGEQMGLSGPQLENTEEHHNQTGLQSTEEHISRSDQQKDSTEGCLNQSEVEICELAVADTKEVLNDQHFLTELARTEESSTDESLQIVAHIECQEVMLPDTSSCSSVTETDMHEGGKACDVNERTPPSFLGVKEDSKSETLHPPADVKSEVTNEQQMEVPEKEAGNSLATEGIFLPAGSPCPSEGLSENHDKKQEEGTNKKNDVALPSREPHPHELSNQEPIGELRHIQFDGEDPLGDAKEQSRASEPKQEDRKSMQDSEIKETKTESGDVHLDGHTEQTVVGSEVTEKETGEHDVYSDSRTEQPVLGSDVTEKEARGDNAHSESRTEEAVLGSEVTETQPGECGVPLDSQTGETLPQEQRDTLEHKGAETSDQEVLSLKDSGLGTKSCPTVGKEPTGNAMEKMGHETEVVDTECTADHTATTSITQNPASPETVSETTSSNPLITKESNDPACSIGLPSDLDLELGKGEKNFEDSKEKKSGSSDRTHIPPEREEVDLPAEDQVDSQRRPVPDPGKVDGAEIHKDDSFLCYNPFVDPPQQREQSPEPQESLCLTPPSAGSSVSASRPDSGSDGDGFFGTDVGEDGVFRKDPQVGDSTSEVSISCSSNEDAVSMGPPGSSADGGVVGRQSWNSEEVQQQEAEGRKEGDEEEEEKDHVTEVPARSSLLRCSERSPSPFRRHSWGPGKTSEGDISQCSLTGSLRKGTPTLQRRSYSLEGLTTDRYETKDGRQQLASPLDPCLARHPESEERGSLVSLTEEDLGSDQAERCSSLGSQTPEVFRPTRCIHGSMTLPLMKSVSLLAINQRDLDGMRSFSSVSGSLSHSISEEDPGPLRAGVEGKSVTKVGRTFSYLRNKMYKKTKEKEKEKNRVKEKEREAKEKEKRTLNGHIFSAVSSVPFGQCHQCHRVINSKEASYCTNCNAHVHKSCRETLPACTKIKMKLPKQQFAVPDSSTLKSKSLRERPWSILTAEDDGSRRHSGIKSFSSTNLSKSISISNIAGPVLDEIPLKGLRYLSQSTDSLHKTSKVNESTESLTDEGTDMMDSQLMGEFEVDARELEADSWSFTVDRKYLKQFKKDMIKRQDVIYELMQTEMHHVRTLRIVAEVYSKGLLKEVQLEAQTVERVFPALDDLLDIHSGFLSRILDRRKESRQEGGFLIRKIGDILVAQFSGSSAERMKKVYGKFCSRHKEALSFYKELHAKDKRFQAFIKKKMSSPVVRRLGIPECILLVTQRITKYPVLLQRMLQHTKEGDEDHVAVTQALGLVKEVIAAVDSKVNDQEKKQRLREVYRRTDSRSIMRMKSGQMFAREDLLRGRKLLHDGPLQLKTSAGRLKDVQALLLSDVFVFLQEKDQKYIFASLDQRATVLSLQKLIIREVANEEKGLFLITAGIEQPEMVEVHASSKEERNTWIQLIQEAVSSMEKEEDEGIPTESEEDKRVLEMKARELRDQLHEKDQEIAALLEEKLKVFRSFGDDSRLRSAASFRASAHDTLKGETVMKDALREVEVLQTLLNSGLGGVAGQQVGGALESTGGMGSVKPSRRLETCGDIGSISKTGGRDSPDLLRKESDGTLKKGVNANLLQMLKRDSEQVLQSTCHLHELLNTLQAVVVQQDSILEEQRQALNDRSSSSPSSSSSSWRTSSLIEQEKQRSLEKQRQEAANLQRQQAAHTEERRRREREWEVREEQLREREAQLLLFEEEMRQGREEVMKEQQELRGRKEEYQRDLERLREAQRRLERDREHVDQELSTTEHAGLAGEKMSSRAPSTASEDSLRVHSPVEKKSSSPVRDTLRRIGSKRKGKTLNPFASNQSQKAPSGEGQSHISGRLLQLAKTKDPKEKKEKKKKGKGLPQPTDSTLVSVSE